MNTSNMSAQHTPGPWVVNVKHPARNNDSETVIEMGDGSSPIAVCHPINEYATTAQRGANARLIAAAPDMLDALHSAVASLEQLVKLDRIPASNKGLRDARAALAKATGGAA